jgi:hypothetical protein
MKKLVNENLQEFRDNKFFENIEIFKIQYNKKSDKKFSLIFLNNANEGENLFSFNNPITLSKYLYKEKLNEALSKDPYTDEDQMDETESQLIFLKMAKKLKKENLINFPNGNIKQLGKGGTNGFAYDLGNEVLKITVDKVEANNKIKLIGKSPKTLVKVYEMLLIKYINKQNINNEFTYFFVIREEKLTNVGEVDVTDAIDLEPALLSKKGRTPLLEAGLNSKGKINDEIKLLYKQYIKSALETKNSIIIKHRNFLIKLYFEMGLYEIFSDDYTVSDNLGKRGKDIVFFDIGGRIPMGGNVKNPSTKYTNLLEKPNLEITTKIPIKPGKNIKD